MALLVEEPGAEQKPVHLDAVLGKLGAFGKHQVFTLCMIALVYATGTMYNVNYVFAVEEVHYRTNNKRNRNVEACFGLACEEWKRALVGTAHIFGNMLGLLVQGQISDRYGRKTAAVFAGTLGGVLGLAKSCASEYWTYVVLETLEAAVGDALSPMFMLSIEIVEKEKAILYQMILLNVATCGLIILPFISWALPYWRHFLRFIYAPALILLTYSFFLDESIRWLFSKGKKDRGIQIIEKIAKRNDVAIDRQILNKLDYVEEDDSSNLNDWKLLLKTFKSRIMMQRFLVCMVWWFTITLINYGMMISSVSFGGNKYVNFALLMLMDIPANVFYWLALSKYRRKMPLLTSFLVGGVFCVSQPFVPEGNEHFVF
ncbi:hypothetical protein MSG28_009016 [Choristoneura fumiferana]|uniref:Uncharacterized protein n=1 Tax=Choristoneura fumiferana TaxID=7141 RepID=A0ACC0J8Y8_CHOFU|nr:hypothetical protein MSG28_009016 [Choristoneura fumiferana]